MNKGASSISVNLFKFFNPFIPWRPYCPYLPCFPFLAFISLLNTKSFVLFTAYTYIYIYKWRFYHFLCFCWQYPILTKCQYSDNECISEKVHIQVEKSAEKIWRIRKSSYLCNRNEVKTTSATQRDRFWKIFEKSCKKIWRLENLVLPLQPLSPQKRKQGSEKKVWKIFQKDLVVWKKGLTFASLSATKKRSNKTRSSGLTELRIVLIEIYEQRSLKLLSSKVFIHSKEWFQTIPLRLELKI